MIADEFIGIHREAHRATRGAPLETGFGENFVEPEFFALERDDLGARDSDRFDAGCDFAPLDVLGDFLEIGKASVGARAEESDVDFSTLDRSARG